MPTAPVLADRLELKRTGHEWHGPCPACGGEDRFHVREGDQGRAIIGCRGCIDGQPHEVRRAQFKRIMALVFGEKESKPQLSQSEIDRINRNRREAAGNRLRAAREASKQADALLQDAQFATHPYLANKGFPGQRMLVREGLLLVPIRKDGHRQLMSVQTIDADGNKRFLSGSQVRGGSMVIGRSDEHWVCEGLATGLSLLEASRVLHRSVAIHIAFSASNMPLVAAPGYHVIADHDWYTCNNRGCKYRWDDPDLPTETRCPKCDTKKVSMPAGQMYAMRCSENFWMPREPGTDANDYHRAHGLSALARHLQIFTAANQARL